MKKKKYKLNCGFVVKAPLKSCLFCKHCTDIFYDFGGIYNTYCDKNKDVVKGSQGKCCFYKRG